MCSRHLPYIDSLCLLNNRMWWVLLSSPILQWRRTERLNYLCQVRQFTYNRNRDLYLATWPQSPRASPKRPGGYMVWSWKLEGKCCYVCLPAPSCGDRDSWDTCLMTSGNYMWHRTLSRLQGSQHVAGQVWHVTIPWPAGPPDGAPLYLCRHLQLRGEVAEPTLGFTRTHHGSLLFWNWLSGSLECFPF